MSRSRMVRLDLLEPFQAVNLLLDPGHSPGKVIVPSCAQVGLVWQLADGKLAHNVLYGKYSGAYALGATQCDTIKNVLGNGAQWTALAALLGTTCGLVAVTLRDVNTADNVLASSATTLIPGTGASPLLPSEMAVCVTLRTAKSGPANRGRFYLSGFTAAQVAAGDVIAAGAITAINNWANTIPTALNPQGLALSIGQPARIAYTGSTGTPHPARAATSTPVTTQSVRDNHWDSQRRRGLK